MRIRKRPHHIMRALQRIQGVRAMTGRLVCLLLISVLLLTIPVQGAVTVPVIVKLLPSASTSIISTVLGGTIIDSIPGTNILLVNLPSVPVVTPLLKLLGVEWVEPNTSLALGPVGVVG